MRTLVLSACAGLAMLCATAQAQTYPSRTVRIIVPSAPGGGTDIVARVLALHFAKAMGQQFVVENRPGALNYGSAGTGTSPHMSMEMLKSMAGIDLAHIPYKGTAPAVTDLIGGQVGAMFVNTLTARPHVDSGRLRALAVTGARRSDALPESGVANYVAVQWYGLLAPAGTPAAIITRIHDEAVKALQTEDVKQKLAADGADPVGSTPAEFAKLIKDDLEKWTRVARAAKIEPQ